MKVVILAGGKGSRMSGTSPNVPKPMCEIGGKPILWHIMSVYRTHGFKEFILALGYGAEYIKSYFLNYHAMAHNFSIHPVTGEMKVGPQPDQEWLVHLVDTGAETQTGGRLKRLEAWLGHEETFMLTYGDGLANVNLTELLQFHRSHGKLATVTNVRPPQTFGVLHLQEHMVTHFEEKPHDENRRINGGFFVLNREVLSYLVDDDTVFEKEPLEALARSGQLAGYAHNGFWQCMDTPKDQQALEELWRSSRPPWKVWD